MDLRIGDISLQRPELPGKLGEQEASNAVTGAKTFADYLTDAVGKVSDADKAAQDIGTAFALGEPVEVHDVMLAYGKAELSFRLFLELRNKVIEAYQEIMRMPV
jgi:flagellar hook-basal body complex protein FliE